MIDFDFQIPTKIFFGKNRENEVGKIIADYGFKKVLVHYGKNSVIKSGLLDKVINSLKEYKINYVLQGGVEPNPKLAFVKESIALARKEQVDFILALGGGSVIDSAKSIAAGYYYDGDPFDFNLKKATLTKNLPIGTILTIAAAGSELSTSCVITDSDSCIKRGFNSELNRPLFSIMNPELTYSVSKYQTACGIVDIMMHTLERYFSVSSSLEFSDDIALGLLKNVYKNGKVVMENPSDYESRANLMIASSISHAGYTSLGKKYSMPVHQLEHVVSGVYDFVAHGAGLAVLFPAWALNVYKYDIEKFQRFALEVMEVEHTTPEQDALNGILKLQEFFKNIGMPIYMEDLGINDFDMNLFVNILTNNGQYQVPSIGGPIGKELAIKIFTTARKE